MTVRIVPRLFNGEVKIPASKSHTIRRLLIASLADGVSEIINPLDSLDTRSCLSACRAFGAEITEENGEKTDNLSRWKIKGNNNFKNTAPLRELSGKASQNSADLPVRIDVGGSGTTLFFSLAIAGLQSERIEFSGDEQIQKRSAAPLLDALAALGVQSQSGCGCVPIQIKGPWKGGKAVLPCLTSQYLSAMLIASPLAPAGSTTEIEVPLLNEKPYIDMTLSYLNAHNIPYEAPLPDYSRFVIPGGSAWKAYTSVVPGDFSSAAFPAAAAVISGGRAVMSGLDPQDSQGDKYFFEILKKMGCDIQWQGCGEKGFSLAVSRGGSLRGGTFDLNETPDLLPAAAAVAAFAQGDTAFVNVPHARIKECDRIAAAAKELAKLGVSCTELPGGLVVHGNGGASPGGKNIVIDGHGDHRIVMAFAAAALGCQNPVMITDAESPAAAYPGFFEMMEASLQGPAP